jgi:hypothetical protein
MTSSATVIGAARFAGARVPDRVGMAKVRLYDAETALHAARQTAVDSWVTAAYDRLHEAISEYTAAVAAARV